jgi:hypothetical protein
MQFWATLWTAVWFAGLGIFSVLSIMVIIFGAGDLVSLFASLKARSECSQEDLDHSGTTPSE